MINTSVFKYLNPHSSNLTLSRTPTKSPTDLKLLAHTVGPIRAHLIEVLYPDFILPHAWIIIYRYTAWEQNVKDQILISVK